MHSLEGVYLSEKEKEERKEGTVYGWAYVAGKEIIKHLEEMHGDKAGKKLETYLLTLRSELIPERFKRALIDILIEFTPEIGIPEEIKVEKRWSIDEYYRYSTAILAGFLDALNTWRREKEKKTKEEEVKKSA